jgi:MFS superfamily sulfate permease-like transporter
VESGLFFANADHVRNRIRTIAGADTVTAVVLDAETVPFVDVTAAQMLTDLALDLERAGVVLVLARDIGQVRDILRRAGADTLVDHVYPNVNAAVAAARTRP